MIRDFMGAGSGRQRIENSIVYARSCKSASRWSCSGKFKSRLVDANCGVGRAGKFRCLKHIAGVTIIASAVVLGWVVLRQAADDKHFCFIEKIRICGIPYFDFSL